MSVLHSTGMQLHVVSCKTSMCTLSCLKKREKVVVFFFFFGLFGFFCALRSPVYCYPEFTVI